MPTLTRQIEIQPIASDNCGAIVKKIHAIHNELYLAANLVVAESFKRYWSVELPSVTYLNHLEEVRQVDEKIKEAFIIFHSLESSHQPAQREIISKLKNEKEHLVRFKLKQEFAQACATDSILQDLEFRFAKIPKEILFYTFYHILQNFLIHLPQLKDGTHHLPHYKKGMPIHFGYPEKQPFRKDLYGNYYFDWIELEGKQPRFQFVFGKDKSGNKTLLDKIISGEYEAGDPSIIITKRNELKLGLVIKVKEPEPKKLDRNLCLGVDMGYNIPAFWGLSNFSDAQPIGSKELFLKTHRTFERRFSILNKSLASAKGGKGRKRKLKLLLLKKSARLYIANENYGIANTVIKVALEKGAGTIKIENLDFTKKKKELADRSHKQNEKYAKQGQQKKFPGYYDRMLAMFRYWSYGQFVRALITKAKSVGIDILFVDARLTSKKCYRCASKGKRHVQKYLEFTFNTPCKRSYCPLIETKLGRGKFKRTVYRIEADKNAAFNIAQADKERIKRIG